MRKFYQCGRSISTNICEQFICNNGQIIPSFHSIGSCLFLQIITFSSCRMLKFTVVCAWWLIICYVEDNKFYCCSDDLERLSRQTNLQTRSRTGTYRVSWDCAYIYVPFHVHWTSMAVRSIRNDVRRFLVYVHVHRVQRFGYIHERALGYVPMYVHSARTRTSWREVSYFN